MVYHSASSLDTTPGMTPSPTTVPLSEGNDAATHSHHGCGDELPDFNLGGPRLSDPETAKFTDQTQIPRLLDMLVEAIESTLSARMKSVDKVPSRSTVREAHTPTSPDVGAYAIKYIQSYFEQVHPLYPFLDRKTFEDRVFSPQLTHELATDKSWSALYHAVLAIGSQYHDGGSFVPGKGQAWRYFEVTFSLCPDLLIFKANLTTVQALTAMAVFARNISCIQLESITVSQAARMAQSLGYNRTTGSSAASTQRTFWVLYCMEKTTCFYTGKTSLLSDHDIGFAPPSHPEPAFQNFDWLTAFSRHGRLVSRIYGSLFAINASGKSASTYYRIIGELRAELESWRLSMPEPFRPGEDGGGAFRVRAFGGGGAGPPATTVAVFVRYLYLSVVLALARATLHVARTTEEECAKHQAAKRELMGAARRVLELCRYVEVEAFSHVWVLVFMPLSALFILFDFVVHNPVHPETNNNLALLDIAGGHFSHLECVSRGTLPASLVAEFAHIARQYVQDFRLQQYQKIKGMAVQPTPMSGAGATANPAMAASASITARAAPTAIPTPPGSAGEVLWKMTGAMVAAEQLPGSKGIEASQQNQNTGDGYPVPNVPGLEYTDPLVFSFGDNMVSEPMESGLGVDIMDLFDIDLSDIWSLAV
ncbi:fungal specific transcription factor domain containing protein [Diplodia corticola]|uniref:Fungal specific transcription factor domain containing protein n=1 Tax=Diplodia corticola TaxID=236234 RepID=A0A1J9RCQ3_9PEZI|nr:fungal specific transcription factor domain containing protein [Diplodia corticola]OJD30283.1 fungal specific transcription factor domain containing protein [Diplodia corticola]